MCRMTRWVCTTIEQRLASRAPLARFADAHSKRFLGFLWSCDFCPGKASSQSRSSPSVQDEKECAYYLRTGTCKYGTTCKYHHPVSAGFPDASSLGYPSLGLMGPEPQATQNQSFPQLLQQGGPAGMLLLSAPVYFFLRKGHME